jgi:hypothetical protein
MTGRYFNRVHATFAVDAIAPDMLGLLEDGLAYRKLRGLSVRPEARAAVVELHRIVWVEMFGSSADDADARDSWAPVDDIFITVTQLANLAGVNPTFIRRQCRDGALRSYARKVGPKHAIERDPAMRWLRARGK